MKTYLIALVAAVAFCLGCISPSGGSLFNVFIAAEGEVIGSYDLNTFVAIVDGNGVAIFRDSTLHAPIYPPFVWDGSDLILVRIHDEDGVEFEETYGRAPPGQWTYLPENLRDNFAALFTQSEMAEYMIRFGIEGGKAGTD